VRVGEADYLSGRLLTLRADTFVTVLVLMLMGGSGVVAQSAIPIDSSFTERLGVAALFIGFLIVALKWFAARDQKKDDRIEALQKEHTAMLYTAILQNTTSNKGVEHALAAATAELHEFRKSLAKSIPPA